MSEPLSMDQALIRKLTDIVLANLQDENFGVEKLAMEAGLSRFTIHRKLKSIKQRDVSQFIREVRLQRGMEMLQNNEGTVAEIAFRVGFGSPAYFTKCFREHYGYPPGKVKGNNLMSSEESLHIRSDGKSDIKKRPLNRLNLTFSGIAILTLLVIFFIYQSSGKRITLAVLPFKNDSPNDSTTPFIDGITEEIRSNLQTINVEVISRTSVEQFRGPIILTIPEIAKKLRVNYIVEGSGQKYGNKIRLRVQLFRADKERHLWGKQYDREIRKTSDITGIESEIAQAIAAELEAVITPQAKQIIEKTPTKNFEALRLYMVGNSLMTQMTEYSYRKAIEKYQQAIELDSAFAQAYAGMASCYFELSMWDVAVPSADFIPQARAWALKALEINNNLAEAYYVIGEIKYIHEWDWNGAEQAFKKGMGLNPNVVYGRINYANFLTAMGRFKESIKISQQTLKLDPLNPTVYVELAFAMFFNGQHVDALELTNKGLELNPNFDQTLCVLVQFYAWKGLFDQAMFHWKKIISVNDNDIRKIGSFHIGLIGQAFGVAGHRTEVMPFLDELNRRAEKGDYVPNTCFGFIYKAMGDNEKAIDFFEKGFNEKEPIMVWINVFYMNDSIRSNKRFKELLRKMRF